MATMLRASERTRAIIKRYAEIESRSQVELLEEAVEMWDRQKRLAEMKRGYEAIYSNPGLRAELEAEASLYDGTASDGIGKA
jgi:hypothetical protein